MTSPATPNYDKFEVSDCGVSGVALHFYNYTRYISGQDTTDLKEFHQILKSQNWIDVRLRLETPASHVTFGIMPNAEVLTFSVDGKLWNLENKDVYNRITEQIGLLIDRLALCNAKSKKLTYGSKLTKESVSLVNYEHGLTLISHYASGGTQHTHIGLAGFGELLRALVELDDGHSYSYDVCKEGVDAFTIQNEPKCHCVHVNIQYQNGTKRFTTLSYYDIRSLASEVDRWLLPEMLEGYGNTFDLDMVRDTLQTKYDRDSDVKHAEEVAPPTVPPTPAVGITEVCKFLMDHPEHHTTILTMLREMEAKRTPIKP